MNQTKNDASAGIRAIAGVYGLCAAYLAIAGAVMLARPGLVPMSAGAPLLFGLELSGPAMFLLTAIIAGAVAWGLIRLNNLARRAAILIAIAGVVMLVPPVSAAAMMVEPWPVARGGLGIIVRVVVVWYLSRAEAAGQFRRSP